MSEVFGTPKVDVPLTPANAVSMAEGEQIVTAAWRDVLELEHIGRDENFFDIGGDSLLLFSLHVRLQDLLKREIPLLDMVRFPTVGTFVAALCAPAGGPTPSEVLVEQAEHRRHLYTKAMRAR
jgi:acyl carrier protein